MENLNNNLPGNNDVNKPIPLDDIEEHNPGSGGGVSRAPLNLGSSGQTRAVPQRPRSVQSQRPAVQKNPRPAGVQTTQPVTAHNAPVAQMASFGRITGVKTFFTKLHAGALEFLDEQIKSWLEKNPEIVVKRTNITTGEVTGKKSEPNILITVWY
jgi:hypothetical protein